jgi:DNA-binding NarL/FixJ family response regulator
MKHNILVVQDQITAPQIREVLNSLGYQAGRSVRTAEEAIALAERLRPDIVLMDIVLPGKVDGIEAAQRILEDLGIPVIFLTDSTEPGLVEQAARLRHSGYLVKPVHQRQLEAALALALMGDGPKKPPATDLGNAERVYELLTVLEELKESGCTTADSLRRVAALAPFLCPEPHRMRARILLDGSMYGPRLGAAVRSHRKFPILCGDQPRGFLEMVALPQGSEDSKGPLCPDTACIPKFLAAYLSTLIEWGGLNALSEERTVCFLELKSRIVQLGEIIEGQIRATGDAANEAGEPAPAILPFSLTPRERRIAEMIRDGQSTGAIAAALGISFMTVKSHRKRIRRKLGIQAQRVHFQSYLSQVLK